MFALICICHALFCGFVFCNQGKWERLNDAQCDELFEKTALEQFGKPSDFVWWKDIERKADVRRVGEKNDETHYVMLEDRSGTSKASAGDAGLRGRCRSRSRQRRHSGSHGRRWRSDSREGESFSRPRFSSHERRRSRGRSRGRSRSRSGSRSRRRGEGAQAAQQQQQALPQPEQQQQQAQGSGRGRGVRGGNKALKALAQDPDNAGLAWQCERKELKTKVLQLHAALNASFKDATRLFNRCGTSLDTVDLPDTRENIVSASQDLLKKLDTWSNELSSMRLAGKEAFLKDFEGKKVEHQELLITLNRATSTMSYFLSVGSRNAKAKSNQMGYATRKVNSRDYLALTCCVSLWFNVRVFCLSNIFLFEFYRNKSMGDTLSLPMTCCVVAVPPLFAGKGQPRRRWLREGVREDCHDWHVGSGCIRSRGGCCRRGLLAHGQAVATGTVRRGLR